MDDLQDDRLRALVKMAREDFDEEPPARIDALLMAAARHHAPPPKAGAFERLRRWLAASMMNPAIAGATALVVIGGAAGVLYMRNQGRIAEPTVSRNAPVRAEMRATAPEPTLPAPGPIDEAEAAQHLGAIADVEGLQAPVVPEKRPDPRPDPKPKGRGTGTFDRVGTGPGGSEVVAATGGVTDPFGAGRDADKQVATNDKLEIADDRGRPIGGVVTEMPLRSPPPPPPPPDTGAITVEEDTVAQTPETRTTVATPSNRRQAENLLMQARTAAKKKNCPPVKVMAKRVEKLDAAYYRSTFVVDPAVKPCLD